MTGFLNHPILLAAAAVVAVGMVVYEIISRQNEKKRSYRDRRQRSPPPSPPSKPKRSNLPSLPSKSDSQRPGGTDTASSNNNVRQRKPNQNVSRPNSSEVTKPEIDPKVPCDMKEKSISCKDDQSMCRNLTSNACNQNVDDKKFDEINYEKNVFDKICNDTKEVKKNNESLVKNIDEEDSDSSENNLPSKNEDKLINTDSPSQRDQPSSNSSDQQTNQSFALQSAANSKVCCKLDSEFFDSSSSFDSETCDKCSSLNTEEELYKEKVRNVLKSDVESENELSCVNLQSPNASSSGRSDGAIRRKKSLTITESKTCRGCEENPVNTRAQPCNHRYLCLDCAIRCFRLFRKCSICLHVFVEFVAFEP